MQPTDAADAIEALEAWRDEHLRDTRFSRDTATWNRIQESIAAMRAALENCRGT